MLTNNQYKYSISYQLNQKEAVDSMNMTQEENGQWKCIIKDLNITFYTEEHEQAVRIAWGLGMVKDKLN